MQPAPLCPSLWRGIVKFVPTRNNHKSKKSKKTKKLSQKDHPSGQQQQTNSSKKKKRNKHTSSNVGKFTSFCHLHSTSFPMRAGAVEHTLLDRWTASGLYQRCSSLNADGKKQFFLHDGPPYANGSLHLGHALNKTLKDAVVKYKRMQGFHCPFVPGWDCHGLPVELEVTKAMKKELGDVKVRDCELDPREVRERCRAHAGKWVEHQKQQFKDMGVHANWSAPYRTMDRRYEAETLRTFAKFVDSGNVYRSSMTVPWCSSCSTTLAKAEMEYKNVTSDPSLYVLFEFSKQSLSTLCEAHEVFATLECPSLNVLVWTTTPWTLPMNSAVALAPRGEYLVVRSRQRERNYLVESNAFKLLSVRYPGTFDGDTVLASLPSSVFNGSLLHAPCEPSRFVPVVLDDLVVLAGKSLDRNTDDADGGSQSDSPATGAVHLAPGCGVEDYHVGVHLSLPVLSFTDQFGQYTENVCLEQLRGKHVTKEGNALVLEYLEQHGSLFLLSTVSHSFPHCWRCHSPLMYRATPQWFCSLTKNDLVKDTLASVADSALQMVPPSARTSFLSSLGQREQWCLSRQRVWGVPVVAFHCRNCGDSLLDADAVRRVADGVEQHGLEYWWNQGDQDEPYFDLAQVSLRCSSCGNSDTALFSKDPDVLDVWFDSGASCATVPVHYGMKATSPVDLYLEGKDQYRGWYQTSFLTSMECNGRAPTKAVVSHGFVVDEHGRKYSKSAANGVNPAAVKERFNSDVLRLWACSSDYTKDVRMSDDQLLLNATNYRKLRTAIRFLLSNLTDFDALHDSLPVASLFLLDKWMLCCLSGVVEEYEKAMDVYDVRAACSAVNLFVRVELGSTYFEMCKQRLYFEKKDSPARRSCQTVLFTLLDNLLRLLSPFASFLSEEAYLVMLAEHPYLDINTDSSVHLLAFPQCVMRWSDLATLLQMDSASVQSLFQELFAMKTAVNVLCSPAGDVQLSSFQALVSVSVPSGLSLHRLLQLMSQSLDTYPYTLEDFFLASSVQVHESDGPLPDGFLVAVDTDESALVCERCKRYGLHASVNVSLNGKDTPACLCDRCSAYVGSMSE